MLPAKPVIAVTNLSSPVAAAASPRRRSIKASMLRSRTQFKPGAEGSASASQLFGGADCSLFGDNGIPERGRQFGYAPDARQFRFRFEQKRKQLRPHRRIGELGCNVVCSVHMREIRRAR